MKKYSKLMAVLLVVAMLLPGIAQAATGTQDQAKVMRVAGDSRVGTSIKVSEVAMESATDAVLVGYSGEADALTGGILAKAKNAPLFYVRASEVEAVKARLDKLGVANVHILGGTTVFTKELMKEFDAYNPVRIDGDNRYETAINAAKVAVGDKAETVFLAKGNETLADALSIGAISAKTDTPLLLTHGKNLTEVTKQALKDMEVKKIEIVGGKSAVSEEIKEELEKLGYTVNRTAGDNRQATSVEIAKKFNPDAKEIVIANGFDYADAVTAGYFAAGRDAVVLLTNQNLVHPSVKEFLEDNKLDTTVLGGTSAIAKGTFDKVVEYLDGVVVEMPEEEEEIELKVESVSAINAKALKVKFNKAVDTTKAIMEAKRGSVKPSVKEIKFAEDKMSATIEFNAVMIAGDYTVTVTGLTEEALTGTVKVEAEKLTKIEFLSDVAVQSEVMTGTTLDNINLKMNVQAKNQYDEIVNDKLRASSISITASKGASTGHEISKEGILTIKGNATDMFKVDDKVVVTIVDSETGVTATKTVTVVKSAQVDTIVLGELKTDDVELAKKPINVNNMGSEFAKYYIPVEIKDQYGNVLKAAELKDVNVLSSNDNIIRLAATKIVDLAKVGTVIKFQAPKSPATHGTAVLTVVAAGTGKTANTTVKVLENAKTDVLTVSTPEKALKLGVKVELPFTAVDQYGNDLVSNTELVKDGGASGSKLLKFTDGSSITTTGATIDYSVDYGNKNKVKLHITPDAENVVITAVSATGKAQTLNLKAEKAPAAASLGGLSKDIYNLIQKGQTQTITLDDIVINDQYGEKINLPAGFSLKFEAEDGAADKIGITNTTLNNSTTSTVISADAKGTEVFEISLIDNTGTAKTLDTRTVTFETVELKDITTFGMKEVGKIFTGHNEKHKNAATDYAKNLTIFGKKGSAEVKVDQGLLVSATATAPIEVVGSAIPYKAIDTKGLDKTATLTGVVAGADNPLTITQTLTYSDAQSVVTDLKVRKTGNEAEIKDGAIVVPANFINGKKIGPVGATSTFQFYGEDQYGVAPREISYTVTNVAKADKSTAPTITISKAGVISVSGASLVEGDTFTITGIVDGVVKTIKVIVGDTVANTSLTASNIAIKTPAKAIYNDGDILDLSSLVVTVTYSNGVTEEIPHAQFVAKGIATDKANGATLATTDTNVVISVNSKTVNQAITVNPVVNSVSVKTAPTKVIYTSGEALDLTGLVVTLTSIDGTKIEDVAFGDFAAKSITTAKANGAILATTDTNVVISVNSKTVNQAITVNPILVTGITVTGTGEATTITTNGGTLQMLAAVLPAGADNKAVTWSVVAGTGTASIDAGGLLRALTNGTVTVKAVAKDGSLVEGTKEITISNQS